jgi:hypothetical protein
MNKFLFLLIIINCIWDFICFIAILNNYPKLLSEAHTNLWVTSSNRDNIAAKHLMAYLVLYWGCMRLYGLIYDLKSIIIFSYIFEGLIFIYEAIIFKSMYIKSSIIISFTSFIIAIIIYKIN